MGYFGQIFVSSENVFSIISALVLLLSERFWQGCRNCIPCVHRDHVEGIFPLKNFLIFKSFLDIQQNFIHFLSIVLRKSCQSCFLGLHSSFLRKFFFQKDVVIYGLWTISENLPAFRQKIRYKRQNCDLRVQWGPFQIFLKQKNQFFFSFFTLIEKTQAVCEIFSRVLSKLHSTCLSNHFGQTFVLKFFFHFRTLNEKVWTFLPKSFQHGGQNCFILFKSDRLKRNFLRKKRKFPSNLWHWAKKLRRVTKIFPTGLSKLAFYLSIGSFWEGSFLMEKNSFSSLHIEWKFSGFLSKKSAKFSKLPLTCPLKFVNKILSSAKISVFYRFRTMSITLSVFSRKEWFKLTKLRSTCPKESFADFLFQQKLAFFKKPMTLSAKKTGFWQKISGMAVKTTFYMFKRIFWRQFFWKKSCIHFLMTLTIKFRPSSKMISKELSKHPSNFPRGCSDEKYSSFRKKFLNSLSDLDSKLFNFLSKFFRRVFKTALYMSKGYFSGTYLFEKVLLFSLVFGIVRKFVGLLSKKNRQCCQNFVLSGQWDLPRYFYCNRKLFFLSTLGHWLKRTSAFR